VSARTVNAGRFVSRLARRSRSNFLYAFLCLPRRQREAIYAAYAFCRIVDDAVDLGGDREEQRRELDRWRREIARVYDDVPEHPAGQRLQAAVRVFPIPRQALLDVIAGVEMDLEHATYETFDDLYPYCYRVASAVPRSVVRYRTRSSRSRSFIRSGAYTGISDCLSSVTSARVDFR